MNSISVIRYVADKTKMRTRMVIKNNEFMVDDVDKDNDAGNVGVKIRSDRRIRAT